MRILMMNKTIFHYLCLELGFGSSFLYYICYELCDIRNCFGQFLSVFFFFFGIAQFSRCFLSSHVLNWNGHCQIFILYLNTDQYFYKKSVCMSIGWSKYHLLDSGQVSDWIWIPIFNGGRFNRSAPLYFIQRMIMMRILIQIWRLQ